MMNDNPMMQWQLFWSQFVWLGQPITFVKFHVVMIETNLFSTLLFLSMAVLRAYPFSSRANWLC